MKKDAENLEKKIIGLMLSIKSGKILKENSGIGKLFTRLKILDLACYENLLVEYKKTLTTLENI